MNPEQWREIERIYLAALRKPRDEREEFVGEQSGGDQEVLDEVLRLLRAGPPSASFMEPPSSSEFDPGASIPEKLGEFQLLEEIGRGSMGIVYRAVQQPLGRVVAVKVLPPSLALTQRKVDRFVREARAAAKLSHPHIAPVITVGEEAGVRYFAMEFVEGHNLAVELKRLHEALKSEGVRPSHLPDSRSNEYFRSVVRLVRDAADALDHAHDQGVIHRDIKPSNLQLDLTGSIHVVDFGLAHDEGQDTLTKSGDVAGTPHYMSPEQARAHRHEIDHRTDVYSLGVVLFELLTLKRPFGGRSSPEILNNILQTPAPRIRRLNSRVPRDLETICETAMSREPADRYMSAGELRDDLERFLQHQAIRARPLSPLQRAVRFGRRRARPLAAIGAVIVALALGAWWSASVVRQRRIDTHLEEIAAVVEAEVPLSELPLEQLVELRQRIRTLRVEIDVLAAGDEDPLSALERDFEEYRVALRTRGLADLEESRDRSLPEGVREMRRLNGLQTLLLASHLFPEDDELRQLASIEAAFPTISVRAVNAQGVEIPAEVRLRAIDPFTTECSPSQPLGRAPLAQASVAPGFYRVVVVFDAGGFRELVCNPGPANMDVELVATRRDDEGEIAAGMISYLPSDYTFADYPGEPCFQGKTIRLEAFQLDVAEVSNAEYYAFMQATGTQPPKYWRLHVEDVAAFVRDYPDRPVVSVTWTEAVAYAEWRGKRLPTFGEWHRAAGGLDNWILPYSADPNAEVLANVGGPENTGDGAQRWRNYREFAADVRSYPDARTPAGAYHMYGNVLEWTESMAVALHPEGGLAAQSDLRFTTGGAWDSNVRKEPMRNPGLWGIGPNYTITNLGFRCAKSVAP